MHFYKGRAILWLAFTLFPNLSQGEWIDPMRRPALKANAWHKALFLDVSPVESGVLAVGAQGAILLGKALDPSIQWTQQSVPTSVTLTAVAAQANTRIAVGHDGMILKEVSPSIWEVVFDGFRANQNMLQETQTLLASKQLAEELRETLEWIQEDLTKDVEQKATQPFLDVAVLDEQGKSILAVGAYGMAFMSNDAGATWNSYTTQLLNPNRYHLNQLLKLDERRWLLVGEQGLVRLSLDQGNTWNIVETETASSWFAAEVKDDQILIAGIQGHILYSHDKGENWRSEIVNAIGTPVIIKRCYQSLFCTFGRKGLISAVRLSEKGAQVVGQWQLINRQDITSATLLKNNWLLTLEKGYQYWPSPTLPALEKESGDE